MCVSSTTSTASGEWAKHDRTLMTAISNMPFVCAINMQSNFSSTMEATSAWKRLWTSPAGGRGARTQYGALPSQMTQPRCIPHVCRALGMCSVMSVHEVYGGIIKLVIKIDPRQHETTELLTHIIRDSIRKSTKGLASAPVPPSIGAPCAALCR